ncbi:MAG: GNAT family protein [Phycisphaeraceae bacterium]
MSTIEPKQVTLRDGWRVLLRSPVEDDAQALLDYLDAVRRETTFLMYGPADALPDLEGERAWVRRSNEHACAVKVAAVADGQIVALCDVTGGHGLYRMQHRAELGISVRAPWCNRGLGTILMRELVAWSRRHADIHVLRLSVLADNARAIAVYRKVGFEVEGVRRRAVRYEDGRFADEMMMSVWVGEAVEDGAVPCRDTIGSH